MTALQILVVDRAATGNDPVAVNFFQLASLAVVSLAAARVFEGPLVFHPSARVLWAQAYLVLLSSIVAFSLQLRAQQRLSPSAAAMIFLLEAPVGALAGGLFAGDRLTALQAGGCALMLAACGLAVLNGEREAPAAPLPVS